MKLRWVWVISAACVVGLIGFGLVVVFRGEAHNVIVLESTTCKSVMKGTPAKLQVVEPDSRHPVRRGVDAYQVKDTIICASALAEGDELSRSKIVDENGKVYSHGGWFPNPDDLCISHTTWDSSGPSTLLTFQRYGDVFGHGAGTK